MAKYLVTGGCGFIGSHLVESLLKDGHSVRILDDLSTGNRNITPAQVEIVVGDVGDSNQVFGCMEDVDGCFHLAAVSSANGLNQYWSKAHKVNLSGTVNVFDAARKKRTPIVYASSAAVYGDSAEMPLSENSSARPLTVYGADKLGSELHARVASLAYCVPTTGLRLFNVYGPRQTSSSPYSGVISTFFEQISSNEPLNIMGDGEQTRDFIYIEDVIHFLRASMRTISCIPSVYNVCTGESVTINQLATIIMSIMGRQVPVIHKPWQKRDIRVSVGDPGYARQMLGTTAKRRLVSGLRTLLKSMEPEPV